MRNRLKNIFISNDGTAMVLAIGIMAVAVALCLSLMAYGYKTYKASLKSRDSIQIRELAVSSAGMIKKQLLGTWYLEEGVTDAVAAKGKDNVTSDNQSDLVTYLMNKSSGSFSFTLKGSGTNYEALFGDAVKIELRLDHNRITVTTTAKYEDSGYRITDTYSITDESGGDENDGYTVWAITFDQRD